MAGAGRPRANPQCSDLHRSVQTSSFFDRLELPRRGKAGLRNRARGRCEPDAMPSAFDELHAERSFEMVHLLCHSTLSQVDRGRGARHVLGAGDGDEGTHLLEAETETSHTLDISRTAHPVDLM